MSDHFIDQFYQETKSKRWRGHRLCAVDGSTLRLPNSEEIAKHFCGMKYGEGLIPLARLSSCYDVMNGLTLDVQVSPYSCSERDLAAMHLIKSKPKDLLIYDRGYPGFFFFALHRQYERDFCMRMPRSFGEEVDDFFNSTCNDKIIKISSSKPGEKQCKKFSFEYNDIKIRLVKVILSTGEVEVLATSLLNEINYPNKDFKALYHSRWGIEEDYKVQKSGFEVENFSGLSVHSIMQDVHAKVFMKNITLAAISLAQPNVDENTKERKLSYQVNKKQAVSRMKNFIVKLNNCLKPLALWENLIILFSKTIESIRPDRSFPRKENKSNRRFHMTIKRAR